MSIYFAQGGYMSYTQTRPRSAGNARDLASARYQLLVPSSTRPALCLLAALFLLFVAPARAQLSQNSGINTADTWVTFDLVVQTQATVNNSIPFTNPQTNATATTYSLAAKPRTFHVEIGYDTTGVVVMNLWPTGTPPNPITDDAGLVSMIRFASGNITVFDQNGVALPFS